MKNIIIDLPVETETDLQALLGLYSGLLGSLKLQQAQSLTILNNLCKQLEIQLKGCFTPEQWQAVQADLNESSQKAANYATANQGKFDDFVIKD